jgi:hypothetical protein
LKDEEQQGKQEKQIDVAYPLIPARLSGYPDHIRNMNGTSLRNKSLTLVGIPKQVIL